MPFSVKGINELADMSFETIDYIISIVDDKDTSRLMSDHFYRTGPHLMHKHAVFTFDDIVDRTHPEAPTRASVSALYRLFETCSKELDIIIHCHGGISRSTAVAIMYLLVTHKLSIEDSYQELFKVRPQMWPNALIIEYIDDHLKLKGKLVAFDKKWKEDNIGVYWPRPPIRIKSL